MAHFCNDIDPAFRGAGVNPGLEIWCVENLQLVPIPKVLHGKFFSGSAYVILHTFLSKSGSHQHEIHYWVGSDAKEADSVLASDKALELDAALGSCAVQYQEIQGQETEKFLSYFRPCIIPIEGVFSSGHVSTESNAYRVSFLRCKGDHALHVEEVPFSRSSLNHNDVFILDTASKIFLFSGCKSSIQLRAKALGVVEYIKDNKHSGKCDIATIDDGKFVADPDAGEFWSFFGGYAPIPKDSSLDIHGLPESESTKLFWITLQGKFCQNAAGVLSRDMLDSDKCYMLDSEAEIFVWMGRSTSITERKKSISAAEDLLSSEGKSRNIRLTSLTEESETSLFKSFFRDWPEKGEVKLYEEGRGKVAAIFKQQGYEVKELPDDDEENHIFVNLCGKTKVFWVEGNDTETIPVGEPTIFYTGDCYILQHTYSGEVREENIFYAWFGRESVVEDRLQAISVMSALVNTTKGEPIMAQIVEGGEPKQFHSILKALIVLKGGRSTRYKRFIEGKGIAYATYEDGKSALFRVQGMSSYNMQAIQVDQVSASLSSSYCYILKTETSVYAWLGNLSSAKDHNLLDRMLTLINPSWQAVLIREGREPDTFWTALGGMTEYPREKKMRGIPEDPRLYLVKSYTGETKVKEIFNFSQDDLTTEDVLILFCYDEVYVWVGRHSSIYSKNEALDLGPRFLEMHTSVGRPLVEIPIYVVSEGFEPALFTRFFEWDSSRANMLGNSFERKLAILRGRNKKLDAPLRSSWKAFSAETINDGIKSLPNEVNRLKVSSSPLSDVSASKLKSSDPRRLSCPPPATEKLWTKSPDLHDVDGDSHNSRKSQGESCSFSFIGLCSAGLVDKLSIRTTGSAGSEQFYQFETDTNLVLYPYDRLKVVSDHPVKDIDMRRREAYLSDDEFSEKFGMTKSTFYKLPKWRQNKLKVSLQLF